MNILVINAGSTSLKFGLFKSEAPEPEVTGSVDWADGHRQQARFALRPFGGSVETALVAAPDHHAAARCAIEGVTRFGAIHAIGHRVVHGGTEFGASVRIDGRVKASIAGLAELAPLHNPPAFEAIAATEAARPDVPQVAVFDTGFFAELPPRAFLYPVPYEWFERWGVRRFGFHGISNAYCARRATEMLPGLRPLRQVTCHLGGGCSATAVRNSVPVATTMGFTPMDGLMMSTRSGSVDPGLLLHMQRRCGLGIEELDRALNKASGLLGVSGISSKFSQIEAAARQGDPRALLAFDLFADRVRAAIGALAVTLGGLEALVFTARIGEDMPGLRAAVCEGLECLGARLDPARNADARPDTDVATPDSRTRILVIHTREDLMIAQEARRVLGG